MSLAFVAFAIFAGQARAQSGDGQLTPLELRTCTFAAGKGARDLDDLAGELNSWMERSRAPAYAAYALLPEIHSAEVDFDLAWVGQWQDGATMGESMAHRAANGADIDAAFERVLSCDSTRNFSVLTVHPPVPPGRFGPLEVATCKLRLGAALDVALAAVGEWVSYTGTTGSTSAHWLLFPAYGERSNARYHFRWAIGYASYAAFGRDYDQLTSGASLDKYNELFGGVLECDSPRLYAVHAIRPAGN